jgi:hypothetical protein
MLFVVLSQRWLGEPLETQPNIGPRLAGANRCVLPSRILAIVEANSTWLPILTSCVLGSFQSSGSATSACRFAFKAGTAKSEQATKCRIADCRKSDRQCHQTKIRCWMATTLVTKEHGHTNRQQLTHEAWAKTSRFSAMATAA